MISCLFLSLLNSLKNDKFYGIKTLITKHCKYSFTLNIFVHFYNATAGVWICFEFRIYQSCEYTKVLNMLEWRKALNKIFHDRFLTLFWICLEFWIYQGSKYLGLHMVLHHGYLTGFWICFEFWTCQCYTGFCRKSYLFDRVPCIPWVLNMLGL